MSDICIGHARSADGNLALCWEPAAYRYWQEGIDEGWPVCIEHAADVRLRLDLVRIESLPRCFEQAR